MFSFALCHDKKREKKIKKGMTRKQDRIRQIRLWQNENQRDNRGGG
jgi:hypothetical protein